MQAVLATSKEIKIRMIERDTSVSKIARDAEVTTEAIRLAFRGELKSARLRDAITSALGWPADRIWEN